MPVPVSLNLDECWRENAKHLGDCLGNASDYNVYATTKPGFLITVDIGAIKWKKWKKKKERNVNLMVMVFWVYTFFKTDKIVHFKYVWFIILQLYLNKLVK
jgi:hypothetical protein